ncbi:hypothetical protein CPB83DRAFT_415184 [Crepidotus variabilis]|uniref:F-box domain-containing protein n=1 Tax=Crepidotus variabilis TaxID=179855 RepID=A0A9P6JVE9_9AGAR|nr:hypothetical protein CPB83DRAFT_415184 [Crepidotus variabilis]
MNGTLHSMPTLSQLPTEIMNDIFVFLLDIDAEANSLDKDCIAVSQVCQRWRAISVSLPVLWTKIPMLYPHWVFILLKRSSSRNIEIGFDPASYHENRILMALKIFKWLLTHHSHRISTFILVDIPPKHLDLFLTIPLSCFPLLRTFWLEIAHDDNLEFQTFGIQRMLRRAIHLNTLRLPVVIDWHAHSKLNLCNLRKLFLVDNVTGSDPPNGADFFNGLKDLPSLEVLVLRDGQLPFSTGGIKEDARVHLARLEDLAITDTLDCIQNFLRRVQLPSTVNMQLHFEVGENVDDVALQAALEEILGKFRHIGQWQCIQFTSWGNPDGYPKFVAWSGLTPNEWPNHQNYPSVDPKLGLTFDAPHLWTSINHMMFQFPSLMGCKDVEYLELIPSFPNEYLDSADLIFSTEEIFRIFGAMPSLKTISAETMNHITPVLAAIVKPVTIEPGETQTTMSSVAFPALESLQLVRFNLHSAHVKYQSPSLFYALRVRQQAEKPISSVVFYDCKLPADTFPSRRELSQDDYDPWTNLEPEDVTKNLQIHSLDIRTIFYFYRCSFR